MRIGKTLLAAATALTLASTLISCNLDGGRGVYQAIYQAPPKSNDKITALLGHTSDNSKVVGIQNGDLHVYTAEEHDRKIADITKSPYMPFFFDGTNIYFAMQNDKGYIDFYYDELTEIESSGSLSPSPATVNFVGGENREVVAFESYNYFLDKVMIFYTFEGENDGASSDEKIKHYGFFEVKKEDGTSDVDPDSHTITVHGDIEVPSTCVVFGDGMIRSFANDSDIDGIRNGNFVIYTEDGTRYDKNITISTGSVRESDIAMGFDGEHLIFLDGDIADVSKNSNRLHNWRGFVNDLIYRQDDIMVPYHLDVDGGWPSFTIGYLYGEGIYVNPDGMDDGEGPRLISMSSDTDIMTTAFIGNKEPTTEGNRRTYEFLMATKENGLWNLHLEITRSEVENDDPNNDPVYTYHYSGSSGRYTGTIQDYKYNHTPKELV